MIRKSDVIRTLLLRHFSNDTVRSQVVPVAVVLGRAEGEVLGGMVVLVTTISEMVIMQVPLLWCNVTVVKASVITGDVTTAVVTIVISVGDMYLCLVV